MPVRERGQSFQADFMLAGVRHRETFTTREEAEDYEHSARTAHRRGLPLPKPGQGAGTPVAGPLHTLEEAIDLTYRTHWLQTDCASAAKQLMNANAAIPFFGVNTPVASITAPGIDDYKDYLYHEVGNGGATVNRKLSALRQAIKLAVRKGWLAAMPLFPGRQPEGKPRMRWLTEQEQENIARLFRHWAMDDYADMMDFMIDTGLRISEARGILWEHVAGTKVMLGVTKATKNGDVLVGQPMTAGAQQIIARRRNLPDGPWRQIKRDHYLRQLARVCDQLGYKDVVIHTFRHTTASRLVQRGVSLAFVQKFMRHKAIATTMGYAKLADTDLDAAVTALEA